MATTKQQFTTLNELRRKEGQPLLNWKEFIRNNPLKKLGRPRMDESQKKPQARRTGMYLNFLPDEKKPIQRPPTVYNNASYTSIYEKYGV